MPCWPECFNFIPNLGPTLSAIFPIFVALLQSPGKAIAVLILYVVIQNVESYWFSPMVMQKQVSLLPAATLIAQIFFATFLGPLGSDSGIAPGRRFLRYGLKKPGLSTSLTATTVPLQFRKLPS